ncbi:MAG TPA: M28 family peptidase, partial [Bacteroidia bacterium]|nr:M28 family peptidase [Bacteroidia bacterium]
MNGKSKIISSALAVVLVIALFMGGCNSGCNHPTPTHADSTHAQPPQTYTVPNFRADSAYKYTQEQVDFGPRIQGSKAHEKCLQFMLAKLRADSLMVTVQKSNAKTFDGKTFDFENVIASSQPNNPVRLLLCTHWDTRPFADADSVNSSGTFDGADDGASGVAMLLELARNLKKANISIGIDLVFFDIEDYGQDANLPADGHYPEMENTWGIGSQYWSKNIPANYAPRFGILLDMVGGKGATFPKEGTGMHYAPDIVNKVWDIAGKLGYDNYFIPDVTGMTTDDHLYVNKIANIPTIDIVHYEILHSDYPYWHHKH